jgi:hypothetical protein
MRHTRSLRTERAVNQGMTDNVYHLFVRAHANLLSGYSDEGFKLALRKDDIFQYE